MKDYIIVGAGLAGICFAETAFTNRKSFVVISDKSQNSSYVAGGIYNPVIVKRLNMPMDAAKHMQFMKPFYASIQQRLGAVYDFEVPLYRRFSSVEEQNNWFEAADKPALAPFLSTEIDHNKYAYFSSPFGLGKVNNTGYVDTAALLNAYHNFLRQEECLLEETFDHHALLVADDHVVYKGISAKHIVFAEGFGIHNNPYFNHLPLVGTKGELLLIKAPALGLDVGVNGGIFIVPVGDGLFKVGATYEWTDKTSTPTEAAKKELLAKFEELVDCPYEVVEHYAGIRPTTKDRKVLIGTHPQHKNIHLLNGLGTRGVMLGPFMAQELFNSIEYNVPVNPTVDLKRFGH